MIIVIIVTDRPAVSHVRHWPRLLRTKNARIGAPLLFCVACFDVPGTYMPWEGSRTLLDCLPCPEGMYCKGTAQLHPTGRCAPGYFCPSGSVEANAKQCTKGNYCVVSSGRSCRTFFFVSEDATLLRSPKNVTGAQNWSFTTLGFFTPGGQPTSSLQPQRWPMWRSKKQ